MRRRVRARAPAVMVGIDARERWKRVQEILRLLVKGDKEVGVGKGHSLENVLKEADRISRKLKLRTAEE